jgi:hypothetical protein
LNLAHGTVCMVAKDNNLVMAKVVSHHPEMAAVKVKISGDEWIFREVEVIKPGDAESSWPEWLRDFTARLRAATKLSKAGAKIINKVETARALKLPYSRVLNMCRVLESFGVNLKP